MSKMSTSFLPTIKCSHCSVEIEISAMGDHVCAKVPVLPDIEARPVDFTVKTAPGSITSTKRRPPKVPPAPINSSYTNHPSGQTVERGFASNKDGLRSISPTMSERSQRPGQVMAPRSATAAAPFRPPSSDIPISQDCAFPPFPASRSRSATPTTPSDPTRCFTSDGATPERRLDRAPASPKRNGSNVLQRMHTIAPGPFNMNDQGNQKPLGHQRTATGNSTKDVVRSSSSSNGSTHSKQTSVSATTRLRKLSFSSIAGCPSRIIHQDMADSPTLPPVPAVTNSNDLSRSPERLQADEPARPVEALSQTGRSQTYPLQSQPKPASTARRALPVRRPSEPAVVAAMKPLHEIGSTSSFKSSKSLKGRKMTTSMDTTVEAVNLRQLPNLETNLEHISPKPKAIRGPEFGTMNPYHTPTESNSSNESSSSDSRSVSSRSTPPMSSSPQRRKGRPSHGGQIDNLLQEFRFGTEQVPVIQEPVPSRRVAAPSFSRPMYPRPVDPSQPSNNPATLSPTDPAIAPRRPGLTDTPSDFGPPIVPLQNGNLRLSPAPPPQPAVPVSPVRKPTIVNKGKCRGCDELIKGKSVSSADGRLTGRYHRSCFVCKTCREPFQTADFYVLENHPFCARHYHELNHSLCKSCDKGIEGQYLETELKQKFHPYCFSCQDCHRILRDDYFEVNGKTYCEQHAFGAAQQQTSLLGPGRRHPERRTTKLMTMA
ncbi:MAG: hypothetical protein L6R36_000991 [Xanthoria steineri]|nr:MAG: hypothetical protein L6R36_000991 [Xanthoria steineri]